MTLYGTPRDTPAPDDARSPDEASALPLMAEAAYVDPPAPRSYRGSRRAHEPDDEPLVPLPREPMDPPMSAESTPQPYDPLTDPHWSQSVYATQPPAYAAPAGRSAEPDGAGLWPGSDPSTDGHSADPYLSQRYSTNGSGTDTPSFNGFAVVNGTSNSDSPNWTAEPSYPQEPSAYGQQPPAWSPEQPVYGQEPSVYGQEPPAWSPEPSVYGQEPPAYGQQPSAWSPEPSVYGQEPPADWQEQAGYGRESSSWTPEPPAWDPDPSGYPATANGRAADGYSPDSNGYGGAAADPYASSANGYPADPYAPSANGYPAEPYASSANGYPADPYVPSVNGYVAEPPAYLAESSAYPPEPSAHGEAQPYAADVPTWTPDPPAYMAEPPSWTPDGESVDDLWSAEPPPAATASATYTGRASVPLSMAPPMLDPLVEPLTATGSDPSAPSGPNSAPGQSPLGLPPVGQPSLGQPSLGQPSLGQPLLGQPPLGQPASEPVPTGTATSTPDASTTSAPVAPASDDTTRVRTKPVPAPADWTEIAIPGEDDLEIVPWDRKPLMIVIAASVILVLIGILAGVASAAYFDPGQTIATWHPAGSRPGPGNPAQGPK